MNIDMSWQHHTPYRFKIQKYKQGTTNFSQIDIEEQFKCRFQKMTGVAPTGVKNTYSEDFSEVSGKKVWVPAPDDLAFESSEMSLYLRWRSDECGDVHQCADDFFNYVVGQKLEWYDTFRKRYLQLILEKAPSIETEILNRKPNYLIVKYVFTNFGGKPDTESQLNKNT